jgi:hypothetical protein
MSILRKNPAGDPQLTCSGAMRRGVWHWYVAIHPAGVEMAGRLVIGSRSDAELQARAMISGWLKKDSTQKPESN